MNNYEYMILMMLMMRRITGIITSMIMIIMIMIIIVVLVLVLIIKSIITVFSYMAMVSIVVIPRLPAHRPRAVGLSLPRLVGRIYPQHSFRTAVMFAQVKTLGRSRMTPAAKPAAVPNEGDVVWVCPVGLLICRL